MTIYTTATKKKHTRPGPVPDDRLAGDDTAIPCYLVTHVEPNPDYPDALIVGFLCPGCRGMHWHSVAADDHAPQHRAAHCWTTAGRALHPHGYRILLPGRSGR